MQVSDIESNEEKYFGNENEGYQIKVVEYD